MVDLPSELYYVIASLVTDINDFKNLSLCCKRSLVGCKQYSKEIIKKYDKVLVFLTSN